MKKKEAIALQPIIDAVRESLERFQAIYDTGGDVDAALIDLQTNMGDLDDAVDKNGQNQ